MISGMNRRHFIKAMGTGSLTALASASSRQEPAAGPGGLGDPRIEVNLAHLRWNLSQLKSRVKVPVMAVVKANAYGHGLVETSRALEKAGVHSLMVGKLQEAVALRQAGIRCPILNFGPFDRGDGGEIIRSKISQAVFTDEAAYLEEAAATAGETAAVHVDIDTGMGRTGAAPEEALPLIEKIASLPHVKIEGVCTTLTEDPVFDKEQLRQFLEVCAAAQAKGIPIGLRHAASSAAVFYSSGFYLDMIRPGITLYGYYPNARTRAEDALKLQPALKLSARVIFLKDLVAGGSLSYLRAIRVKKTIRVATVGIGYSDGYPPQLGGKVSVMIKGKTYPVLEAVTANHLMVELGDDRDVRIGDPVTLIDPDESSGLAADALAEKSGVPDYRLLISLNPMTPRTYSSQHA
jgi:alanine racemase